MNKINQTLAFLMRGSRVQVTQAAPYFTGLCDEVMRRSAGTFVPAKGDISTRIGAITQRKRENGGGFRTTLPLIPAYATRGRER